LHDPTTARLTAEAIEAIGQPGFPAVLAALCEAASGHSSTFVAAYFTGHPPVELFNNLSPKESDTTLTPYLDFAYLLDPFYDLFRSGFGDGVVPLADCAPDDFRSSDYFRRFYAETGLYDETAVFIRFGPDASLILSLGSRDPDRALSAKGHAALEALLPVIKALCQRHWPQLTPERIAGQGRLGQHLEKAFAAFGASVLSAREAEIVRLILKGHSSKSMARALGNSPETIKVHRKRIYAKLGIASQGALFSVFLEALSHTPPNGTGDPLTYLASARGPSGVEWG